jgi:hypothetical protein
MAMVCLYDASFHLQSSGSLKTFGAQVRAADDKAVIRYMSEWLTVGVGTPRRSGKSSAVANLVREKGLKAVVFEPNDAMCRCWDNTGIPCCSAGSLKGMDAIRGRDIDTVIVDEAAWVDRKGMRNVCSFCLPFVRRHLKDGSMFVLMLIGTTNLDAACK